MDFLVKSSQKFFSMKAGCDCGIVFMFICSHIRLLVSASTSPCFDLEIQYPFRRYVKAPLPLNSENMESCKIPSMAGKELKY